MVRSFLFVRNSDITPKNVPVLIRNRLWRGETPTPSGFVTADSVQGFSQADLTDLDRGMIYSKNGNLVWLIRDHDKTAWHAFNSNRYSKAHLISSSGWLLVEFR